MKDVGRVLVGSLEDSKTARWKKGVVTIKCIKLSWAEKTRIPTKLLGAIIWHIMLKSNDKPGYH